MAEVGKKRVFLHGDKFVKFWEDYYKNHQFLDGERVNLYIDFPYCVSNCKYCMYQPANFNTHRSEIPVYEKVLVDHIRSVSHVFNQRQLGQINFGGGTASLFSRECLENIIDAVGPAWDNAMVRKMEVHPHNFSDDYIDFLINTLHITNLSMGIQTFDNEALKGQNRIAINVNELKHYVDKLHAAGVSVNMDLVALFNGETEHDWDIFYNDVKIIREVFNPDMFFTQVNFATEARYYEYTLRLRKFLVDWIKTAPEYVFAEDRYNKLDLRDVQEYLDTTYFMCKPDYLKYLRDNNLYKADPRFGNYIGFGGNLSHRVFSLTSERQTIYSYYDFRRKHWIHELMPTEVPSASKGGPIPTLHVGQYLIPPYNPEISGSEEDLYKALGVSV